MLKGVLRLFSFVLITFLLFTGCSEYNKALKSPDLNYKLEVAKKYYDRQDYIRAYPLFEELLNLYRGTAKSQEVYYYYAMTHYGMEDYILAAYHFKNFSTTFPQSEKAEECAYLAAYCYYLDSPRYSLDQSSTNKAINELQLFINTHPGSARVDTATVYIDKLRDKLEQKSFEIGKQYLKIGDYKSAIFALDNTLNDYPDTEFREEALYLQIRANYLLAANSVDYKKEERYENATRAYQNFIRWFPESNWKKDADKLNDKINSDLEEFRNQEQL
jgi:outer membrane protein assembly factor BamD